MPSITTHYLFAKEVFNHLNKKEQARIQDELNIYYIFAQSHDFLFYYTFDIKEAKRIKDLGHFAHHNNTQDYLINIVKYIKDNHLENNSQLLSYLYGSITHYSLDTTTHPYIFYKTGIYRKNNPASKKYRGQHTLMEKDLDAIYYKKYTNKEYNTCNISKDIIGKPLFSKELKASINQVFKITYNQDNIAHYYYKGIQHAKFISSILVKDYFGLKRLIYRLIDTLTFHHFGYISSYSTHILKPNTKYLNLDHTPWHHPEYKDLVSCESFEDLFNKAMKRALIIIYACNQVLFCNQDISYLQKIIPNLDYSTGIDIEHTHRMDYFE